MFSIVIPLFNEQEIVRELVDRVRSACGGLGMPYEIIVVNDGSTDETLPRLVELSRSVPELRVIQLSRRFGHMPALSAGLRAAKGDAVIVMDGDLQDPPELIPQFYAQWRAGSEIVYGLRTTRREPFLTRKMIALFYWLLDNLSEVPIPKQVGTFCLLDRRIADTINAMPERERYFAGLRAWAGGTTSFVRYERQPRASGPSRVGMGGMFRLARIALVSFSKAPLRYASLLSILYGLALFVIGSYAILTRIFTDLAIPGWATTTALLGMTGFIQGILLAIIAEYIAVIFDELKKRPLFLVQQEFANGKPVGPR
ncbi:MAG: glycosyltransferase family 2 protein [Candidatus Omnitrophica bacterium]|nr:glycosyltransferase family 2 protein [Candidatus Omnitrophota bacterium]